MTNSVVSFGMHAVDALLKIHPERVQQLYIQKDRQDGKIQQLVKLAQAEKIKIDFVTRGKLDELTNSQVHQGIVALCEKARAYTEDDLVELLEQTPQPFFLILDGVQDPHNLGACLRSADAAGVTAVLAPRDKCVGITPTVSKVACGAAESIPFIQVTNLARTLRLLKDEGVWLIGAAGEADNTLYQTKMTGKIALILGAEEKGLRRLTRDHCDFLVRIPMHGNVSSLNVSVATGILLFEALRQRQAQLV